MRNSTFILFFALLTASCHRSNKQPLDTPTSGEISIAADETFSPIIEREITNFQSVYKQTKINAHFKPEGDAIKDLLNDSARIAIVTRKLNDEELKYFQDKGYNPPQHQIATDAVAFVVNPENPDTNFHYEQICAMLDGSVSKWKQINPQSSLEEITLVFDNNNSSTLRYLNDEVNKGKPLPANAFAATSNPDVIDYVSKNKNAIGVIGVSWISERADSQANTFLNKIRTLSISLPDTSRDKEFYEPFQYYIMTGKYPFTRSLYVINAEPRIGLGTGFATYLASDEGQRIILRSGLMPYTQPVRVIELKKNF